MQRTVPYKNDHCILKTCYIFYIWNVIYDIMFKYVSLHNSNILSMFWLLLRVLNFSPVISKSLSLLQPNWTALLS